ATGPEREPEIDSRLERVEAELVEAVGGPASVRLVPQVRERGPPPEREALLERLERGGDVAAAAGLLGLAEPELEEPEVDVLRLGRDDIAAADRLQAIPPDELPELRDMGLQQLRCALRRAVLPDVAE